MPIGDAASEVRTRSDEVANELIRPVLEASGGFDMERVARADDLEHSSSISRNIVKHLIEDDLAVCDISGHNPNVFYELAIRHAFRKPVILIAEEGTKVPFDVTDQNTLFYKTGSWANLSKTKGKLKARVQGVLEGQWRSDNPLDSYSSTQLPEVSTDENRTLKSIADQIESLAASASQTSAELEYIRGHLGGIRKFDHSNPLSGGEDDPPF